MVTSDRSRILLVDDHKLFRKGLVSLLSSRNDMAVVGEAENGNQAVEIARAVMPDLILMDIHMPGGDGLEAVKAIKKEMPGIKIVMLTVSDTDDDLFTAIKNGADGYLLKNLDPSQLFVLLEGIRHGEVPISGVLADRILQEFRKMDARLERHREVGEILTPKEIKTLELLVEGKTNQEMADTQHISENTVKLHLRNIMQKLHLQNRIQLAVYAVRRGLGRDQPDK
jgi:two-component system, NarL family, nitrate/nitrite response regulator NarL